MEQFVTANKAVERLKAHAGIQDDAELAEKLDIPVKAVDVYANGVYKNARQYRILVSGAESKFGLGESFFYEDSDKGAGSGEGPAETDAPKGRGKKDRTGEVIETKDGPAAITAYRGVNDIDVRYEDGTVLEHVKYWAVKMYLRKPSGKQEPEARPIQDDSRAGRLFRGAGGAAMKTQEAANAGFPSVNQPSKNKAEERVGLEAVAANGQKMTIIAYRSKNDIDVRFEDGTVVEHRYFCAFRKGCIGNPNRPAKKGRSKGIAKGGAAGPKAGRKDTAAHSLSRRAASREEALILRDSGMTTPEIATEMGISVSLVYALLADPHSAPFDVDKAVRMIKSGAMRKDICKEFGIGKTTLYKYIGASGINMAELRDASQGAPGKSAKERTGASCSESGKTPKSAASADWTPAWKEPPKASGEYLITTGTGKITVMEYSKEADKWLGDITEGVDAWMPAPKRFKPSMSRAEAKEVLRKNMGLVAVMDDMKEAIGVALGSIRDSEKLADFLMWYRSGEKWTEEELHSRIEALMPKG